MTELFAINLIRAVVGKEINISLDRDFLNALDLAMSEKITLHERIVLQARFGQEQQKSTAQNAKKSNSKNDRTKQQSIAQIAKKLNLEKDEVKGLINSGLQKLDRCLSLSFFKKSAEDLRDIYAYNIEFLPFIKARNYSRRIATRAKEIRKTTCFDIDENDPFSSDTTPDFRRTSSFIIQLDNICDVNIEECPDSKLGCLCATMARIEADLSKYIPCLINREINCAKAERKAGLPSWHSHSFTTNELQIKLADIAELSDIFSKPEFSKYETVGTILAYEAAELAPKLQNDIVKRTEQALITLSNGIWKGWNPFWEKYYSWARTTR